MEAIRHFASQSMKKNVPDLRAGDTVRVHQRIREGSKTRIQVFEGLVIAARGGTGINASFVVRYVHKGTRVGVEKTFPLHSPNVEKVERLKSSKVRQARLFYMRDRFGRQARMKDEVRNIEGWVESAEEPVAEATPDESPAEAEEEMTPENEMPEPASEEVETSADAPAVDSPEETEKSE